jgi:tetratricopeptide (TPR) repeat protein
LGAYQEKLIILSRHFKMKSRSILTISIATVLLCTSYSAQAQTTFLELSPITQTAKVTSIDDFLRREAQILASRDQNRSNQASSLSSELSLFVDQTNDPAIAKKAIAHLAKQYPKSTFIQLLWLHDLETTAAKLPPIREQQYQQIIQQDPTHPIAARQYGTYLQRQKRQSEINQIYENLIQKNPEHLDHYVQFAMLQDSAAGFLRVFDRAVTAIPNEPLLYIEMEQALYLNSLLNGADPKAWSAWHDRLKTAVKVMPKNGQMWAMLISMELSLGNTGIALDQTNTALEQVGEAGYFQMVLGDIKLLHLRSPQAAIGHYKAAIKAGGSFCSSNLTLMDQRVSGLAAAGHKAVAIELAQQSQKTPPTIQKIIPTASQESCDRTLAELNNVLPPPQ